MRKITLATLFMFMLAGCQAGTPVPQTPTLLQASPTPPPPARSPLPPTPTALAEGLVARLATPDPSPDCPDHYPWFFDNRARECAAMVLNTWTVLQPFEHGLMVWSQEGGRTYVFIDDGSPLKPYYEVSDPATAPLPGPDLSIVPPAGLYQPELGFAKFWRGLAPGSGWVRERLGWALALETPYSAFWQCNTASDASARCYFNGPRDEVIAMTRGDALYWNYWQGPVR